jgi:hypothetical protein
VVDQPTQPVVSKPAVADDLAMPGRRLPAIIITPENAHTRLRSASSLPLDAVAKSLTPLQS